LQNLKKGGSIDTNKRVNANIRKITTQARQVDMLAFKLYLNQIDIEPKNNIRG